MKKYNIFKIIDGNFSIDDRGCVSFVNDFNFTENNIKRFYIIENHLNKFIRGLHGHKLENKYCIMIKGSAILVAIDFESKEYYDKIIIDARQPRIIKIPTMNYNGFKLLTQDSKIMFFSDKTLEEAKDDDYRLNLNEIGKELFEIKER